MVHKEHCNCHKIGVESTCLQSFVHVHICIQVNELQELARPIVMGRSCIFVVFQKGDVYAYITMPIFCALPNSITSPSFRCWFIPVSEVREFSRKKEKKKNTSKSGYFRFDTFPTVQMDPFFNET